MVARRSPQTERIIGLINLLTVDDSGEGVTLSELSRRLGVSKATCYPMLEALVDAGFLVRQASRKTFHLGPALVAAGQAAARRDPRQALAREAMVRLGEELQHTCWLYSLDGTHMRVVDQAWHSRVSGPILRVGESFPLRPPVGSVFMAWTSASAVERWFSLGLTPDEERPKYLEKLATIRANGYAVELEETPPDHLRSLALQLTHTSAPSERSRLFDQILPRLTIGSDSLLTDPSPETRYSVQSIDAPIFDGQGRVVLALGVTNLPPLTGSRITEIAKQVSDATRSINTDSAR